MLSALSLQPLMCYRHPNGFFEPKWSVRVTPNPSARVTPRDERCVHRRPARSVRADLKHVWTVRRRHVAGEGPRSILSHIDPY